MNDTELTQYILFKNMSKEEIAHCLKSFGGHVRNYKKGALIFRAGNKTNNMGMVLSGSVTIESNDICGNRMILSHVTEGDFFAETYALLPEETLLVITDRHSEVRTYCQKRFSCVTIHAAVDIHAYYICS